jgi:hypothetical protein
MSTPEGIFQKLLTAVEGSPGPGSSAASKDSSSSSGPSVADQASAAIDQFRSVGKWIITSFAAVATLLLAGVQLTSLGSVHGWRLFGAFAGLGIAVIAAIVAIANLTSVLQPHVSTVEDSVAEAEQEGSPLASFIANHRTLFFPVGIEDVQGLKGKYDEARAARALAQRPSSYSEGNYQELRRSLWNLVWMSSYENAKKEFEESRKVIIGAALAVAVGAALYAWAATAPTTGSNSNSSSAAVGPAPVEVIIKLTGAGQAAFGGILSDKCIEAASGHSGVHAIAVSADSSQTTVILIPTPGKCTAPTKISIPLSDGFATPLSSVVPAASPSSKLSSTARPRGPYYP